MKGFGNSLLNTKTEHQTTFMFSQVLGHRQGHNILYACVCLCVWACIYVRVCVRGGGVRDLENLSSVTIYGVLQL
jgi:hypothetical protein